MPSLITILDNLFAQQDMINQSLQKTIDKLNQENKELKLQIENLQKNQTK